MPWLAFVILIDSISWSRFTAILSSALPPLASKVELYPSTVIVGSARYDTKIKVFT